MNRFLSITLAIAFGGSFSMVGCTGTETGNPGAIDGAKIFLTVASSEVKRISADPKQPPTDLLATDATMSGVTLTFVGCDGKKKVFPKLGLSQDGSGDELALPEGDYCSLIVDLPQGLDTPPMFELRGVRTSDDVPFVVEVAREGQVTLANATGNAVPLAARRSDSYFLALDLALILSSQTVAETPTTAGEAVLDATHSPDLVTVVEASLPGAFVFAPDGNDDGTAEPSELDGAIFVSP